MGSGVSPVIATTLLIAIAVIGSVTVWFWSASYTAKPALAETVQKAFTIVNVYKNSSGDGCHSLDIKNAGGSAINNAVFEVRDLQTGAQAGMGGTWLQDAGLVSYWNIDEGKGNMTNDSAVTKNNGTLNGTILDDFEDGNLNGWSFDCGGVPTNAVVSGYKSDYAMRINSTGGDGVACAHGFAYNASINRTISFACEGYGCYLCVWNGSQCLNSGDGASNHGPTYYDWGTFMTKVDYSQNSVWIYAYNNRSMGYHATYDFITHTPIWINGRFNNGLFFDGRDDYVYIPTASSLNIKNSITVSLWTKSTAQASWRGLFMKASSYRLLKDSSSHTEWSVYLDGIGKTEVHGSTNLADSNWHHVVGTYNGSDIRIYVDGVEETYSSCWRQDQGTASCPLIVPGNITITGNNVIFAQADNQYFNGSIDDVTIFNRSLTASEVSFMYSEGKPLGELAKPSYLNITIELSPGSTQNYNLSMLGNASNRIALPRGAYILRSSTPGYSDLKFTCA